MVKKASQTKIAIYCREKRVEANALKGPKPLIPPPQDGGWNQHHAYQAYYGKRNGTVWSAKCGKVLEGTIRLNGWT
jgi:hypothetical protein